MHPSDNGGKVVANSTVVFRCAVDVKVLGHGTVVWYSRQGVNRYQLGIDSFIHSQFTGPRYRLETESRTPSAAIYRLTITGNNNNN